MARLFEHRSLAYESQRTKGFRPRELCAGEEVLGYGKVVEERQIW